MRSLTLGGIFLSITLFLAAGGPPTTAQDRPSPDPVSAAPPGPAGRRQASRNVDLVGTIETVGIARAIFVEGDYAYIGDDWHGLRIVDISDPTTPVEVGSFVENSQGLRMSPYGFAMEGDILYSADGGLSGESAGSRTNGLCVYDVSDPTSPREIGAYWPDEPWTMRNVVVVGDTTCLAAGSGGLRVLDISDPTNPVELDGLEGPGISLDVKVSGGYAYVTEGSYGLRVIDVSTPSSIQEVATLDTNNAIEVAVVGDYLFIADGDAGLQVIDGSTPTAPVKEVLVGGTGTARAIAVANDYAYLAIDEHGLRVYDVSDPTAPVEVGYYEMASAHDVAVVGSNAYVTQYTMDRDSMILQFSYSLSVSPVVPTSNGTPSSVMQGGTAYRHFRLLEGDGGTPIANATVGFSDGSTANTDASGYFTYTVVADSLGGVGSHSVSVQRVTTGRTYNVGGNPSFSVQIGERRYAHSWSYGAIRRASAGISTGLIAYVHGETNGGMGLTLDESDPSTTSDDRVEMKETFSAETGGGVGVGMRENISVGVVKANLDASVTTEASLRGFGSLQARFDQPYARPDRKAQGIFLLLSAYDSVSGQPSQPMVVRMLREAEASVPYLDYVTAQSAGMAAKITPLHGNVGAELGLSARRDSGREATGQTVGFTLLDAGVSRLVAAVLTDYGSEYSVGFQDELSVNLAALSPNTPGVQNRLLGLVGNQAQHIQKEYFYDTVTGQLTHIELTLSSEGNSSAYTDVTKKRVSMKITIPAGSLTPSLVETVGEAQALSDLDELLTADSNLPYEVRVEDGSSVSVVPELAIPGTEIMVGLGLQVESLRNLVRERGVFVDGEAYVTERYAADSYVAAPGKDWAQLTQNALGGLWLIVEDAFNWVGQQVESGKQWAIEVAAQTVEDVRQGSARLLAPSGSRVLIISSTSHVHIQAAAPITVTAVGWVPETGSAAGSLELRPAAEAASGVGFVVGGLYTFQPYTMTVSPAATLVITYTSEAAAGVDEGDIGMFRWSGEQNNWEPVTAQADLINNSFTASVQRLGTYALGHDGTSPEIALLDPSSGETAATGQPLLTALVTDAGTGVDPDTVAMKLDDQIVTSTFITGTGEVLFLPGTSLDDGEHTWRVSAEDVAGNEAAASSTFTVDTKLYTYLPVVLRSSD